MKLFLSAAKRGLIQTDGLLFLGSERRTDCCCSEGEGS